MLRRCIIGVFVLAIGTSSLQAAQQQAAPVDPVDNPSKCALLWDPLKLCGKLSGDPATDLKRVADRVRQIKKDDLAYAVLKAKKADTPTARVRLQCMQAVQDAATAWDGDNIKDEAGKVIPRPDPALITGIEDVAELVDSLSPQGVLFASCSGAANMFAMGTLQLINAIAIGAALIVPK
jgi:hypothetical protein